MQALQCGDPALGGGTTRQVDEAGHPVEDQVAHVYDVGLFKMDDGVAAGVGRAVIDDVHALVAGFERKRRVERPIGVGLLVERALLLGGAALQLRYVAVGDDLARMGLQRDVAGRVVPVVVRVDQHVDHALGAGVQPFPALRGRLGKLGIDHDERIGRGQPADRAAASGENAHVATKQAERIVLQAKTPGRNKWQERGGQRLLQKRAAIHGDGRSPSGVIHVFQRATGKIRLARHMMIL